MNIMRKLRAGSLPGSGSAEATCSTQHLGLMHLKKLFTEYLHLTQVLSDRERDDKLYNMLPLFCKVFGNSPSSDMTDKFRDLMLFCEKVSKLMVSEIRRRASNQSTETASCAIAKFLEIENSEESSNGWMLLSTLNLLAAGDHSLIQTMTAASLPSTLVKCLYLFFDLPDLMNPDQTDENSDFTPRERRILLQKIFVQLLVRLCSHPGPSEELSKKNDLSLLFSAITSWCPAHNHIWRKSAAEVLMTISRHGLTQPVVNYIHNKGCVGLCIENMQRGQDLSPLEIVEMFVAVFCFLKDSSEVSSNLLEDFRINHGYTFLSDFLLKLEKDPSEEAVEVMRNLVLMIASLSMCGQTELKPSPASMGSLFQMLGFTLPQPSASGSSVRNIQAFLVMQYVFLKSNSAGLCCTILDAISSVYHADNANYFILENQHTLPQFCEKIHLKPTEIQEKFFQLLEFIVFQLNFVPCKELISLSILLKGDGPVSCSIISMQTLLNILRHNVIFKDVYREVGLLEVFVSCFTKYSAKVKERQESSESQTRGGAWSDEDKLGSLVMEALTLLISGNTNNANLFRSSGGSKIAHGLVSHPDSRQQVLGIIRELMLSGGGNEDMGTLLALMHSAPSNALTLKLTILKCVLQCLRESHKTRNVFRKVGGFVYVLSVLVSMEGCLVDEPGPPWDGFSASQILTLLHAVFNTITVAMRFEPANAKFFHQEICLTSLCDTLRLLGCFTQNTQIEECEEVLTFSLEDASFHYLFISSLIDPQLPENIPKALSYACLVLRLLYDVAVDSYDKPTQSLHSIKSPSHKRTIEVQTSVESPGSAKRVSCLNLTPPCPEPLVVHPGVVIAMFHLLPSIFSSKYPELSLRLQVYSAEVIKSLMRSERNQQVMCEAGLPTQLLSVGRIPLQDESHPLHTPLQYKIERLATQCLEPKDLRELLRLGSPLCCGDSVTGGGAVPLTRVKTLVSMTTPRGPLPSPPFTELDMSAEGFGCLYLPSIAPQSPATVTPLTAPDDAVVGGIGAGDRMFPPVTGLSYSTWICVERYSEARTDPHPVRLLTIVRTSSKDQHLICLVLLLSARDKSIIVSTMETPLSQVTSDWEPETGNDWTARVWCPDLLQEGHWHHIILVLNRAVLKNSSVSIYVDGQHLHTQKLHYMSQNPGGGAANLSIASSVYGYIGTPPGWRRYSRLAWKQGPCHLLEEVLGPHTLPLIYRLGPHYLASLQAPQLTVGEPLNALVAEEKIVFGLNAKAVSHLTLLKIRKVYSRVDNKSIAKQLGMPSYENATPIRVLHNSAGHLSGAARSLGGVVVGYLGVRVFTPQPVASMIHSVGGASLLLGLISMAGDVESLYAGVKALVCVVRSDRTTQCEMDRLHGYQTLAMLLRKKKHILNSHILHLVFSLVGTVDSARESSTIPNTTAFQDLLCNIEVWHEAPGDLQRSLFEHLYELVAESSEKKNNLAIMRQMKLVQRLLYILPQVTSNPTRSLMLNLLGALLVAHPSPQDLLSFGQFIVSTLPCSASLCEKNLSLPPERNGETEAEALPPQDRVSNILLRNRCLQLLHSLLFTPRNAVNVPLSDELAGTLGLDWPLLFLQGHVHPSTVVWGLRILVVLCSLPSLLAKFREGTSSGAWLQDTELLLHNKQGVVLAGCQLGAAIPKKDSRLDSSDKAGLPGFQQLSWLLQHHADISHIYFLLMALMMGQTVKQLPQESKLDLVNAWSLLFGVPANQTMSSVMCKVSLCPEAITLMLALVRALLSSQCKVWETEIPERVHYAVNIIQFLLLVYNSSPHLMPVFMSQEVLSALSSALFPLSSEPPTPVQDEVFECQAEERCVSPRDAVTPHPAHKFVMDFLRFIIMDSLSLPIAAKCTPPLDIVLECCGENGNMEEQSKFQTEVLSSLMEHLQETSVLLGDQSCLPVAHGGSAANIAPNISYLASRTVDKLWQGTLAKDGHEVFEFVVKLLVQAKRKQTCLEALYHCLNRTILYLLSRGTETITEQMSVLEALHKLTHHRALIFGAGNHEPDFIGCLVYCLLQFASDMKIQLDVNTKTTWHINPSSEENEELTSRQGQNLISVAARRVWEELYVCKKPAIEEVFKTTVGSSKAPDLCSLRDQLYDTATKMWMAYLDQERKSSYKNPWEMHNQIQSKIQKVTGGLSRLASRSKVRKEDSVRMKSQVSSSETEMLASVAGQTSLVRELVEMQAKQHAMTQLCLEKYVLDEWNQTEAQLTRERAIWGAQLPSRLDKWMLDMTEGPCRMRKKMMRNDLFYLHYPYRPELESGDNVTILLFLKSLKYKVATSWDSKDYFHKFKTQISGEKEISVVSSKLPDDNSREDEEEEEPAQHGLDLTQCAIRRAVKRSISEPDDGQEDNETENTANDEESGPDNQTILRILEQNEKISHMFRCARIQGLDTMEGLLLFGKEHLYIVDGFTLLKSREIRDIDSVPEDLYEPILPAQGPTTTTNKRHCSKFSYEDIREVHKRRYLLQPMALEVFLGDGRNYLLAFPRKIRNKVYQRFMAFATGISDSAQQSVAGQKRTANVEQAASILSSLMGETSVTQRWVRGEITNFQYLMHLNTLAGRSYNDLMQYPVFPWILADYDSERLDLTRPSTFRDFTKPMGAQTNDRLLQFKKRYREWDDPHGETPPYHYGTHYSSAMIVCSYLVRMEPFTQHFLRLQGGHFDLADRMFHSIKEAWLSASKHNMADVKELVPEFFYLPEFLNNANNFDLGCKQNGVELGDVVLPPWAKSDPREFIRLHREALESDYVSQNLHHWIDLIFGYKQQGQPAIEAVNVFHHLFYEGNVDIYSIEDPLKKNATIGFINNFGQIPKQLFKKAHPCKKMGQRISVLDPSSLTGPPLPLAPDRIFYHNLDSLRPSLHPIKELKGPVGEVLQFERSVLAVEQNKVLMPPGWSRYIAWGFADHTLRVGNYDSDRAIATCESVAHTTGEVTACVCPSSNIIITAGTSSVVTIWEYRKKGLSVVETLVGHREAVTCLAASSAYNVIVSGSKDQTAILWDLSRRTFVRQLLSHTAPIAAVSINHLTGDIATCGGTWLHVWSINGEELCRVNTCVGSADRMQQILCVAFSECREWDTHNVILTGSTDGVVRMWSMDYVQVPKEESTVPTSSPVDTPRETNSRLRSRYSEERKSRVKKELAKQMSISAELAVDPEQGLIAKSGSESSLSGGEGDDKDSDKKRKEPDCQPEEKEKCSGDEQNGDTTRHNNSGGEQSPKPNTSGDEISIKHSTSGEDPPEPPTPVVRRRRSSAKNPLLRKSECGGMECLSLPEDGSKLRSSKSETSLTESFIVVGSDGEEVDQPRHQSLRQGFKWQRQLVFRSKLTMHTAYDRKDNTEPASITALAVSRDQRTVYVGDARGRVFSWTVADGAGRADHWLKDDGAEACTACQVRFSLYERRHHCRNCGLLFCSKCSRFESEISRLRILKPVRVCQSCHVFLHSQTQENRNKV